MEKKMIAIDTREIPCEVGYNEKPGRMYYSRSIISDDVHRRARVVKCTDHEAL
ncbi:MAG: hypothetical protein V1766_00230 [Pseudomonadota bacterium]